jgi:hypothetical protein
MKESPSLYTTMALGLELFLSEAEIDRNLSYGLFLLIPKTIYQRSIIVLWHQIRLFFTKIQFCTFVSNDLL